MILKNLSIKNVRSFESQDISFPEGATLLSGEIGSGKTSILMAIEYALFGLQPGQKASSLLRNNADNGEVTLEFEVDGNEVLIERRIKRGTKSISSDYASVTINGKKYESSLTEVKSKVLSLLGYPSEFLKKNNLLYRYTIYTPQEMMKQIVLEDSDVRLNVLRHVFGIEKYKRIRENTFILSTKLKDTIKILQAETKDLEVEKAEKSNIESKKSILTEEVKKEKIEAYELIKTREKIEEEFTELEKHIKIKDKLQSEVEKTHVMFVSKKELLSMNLREMNELKEALSNELEVYDEKKLAKVNESLKVALVDLEKLNTEMINVLSRINIIAITKKDLESKKSRVFSMTLCQTCLQDVPDFHKINILHNTESEIKKNVNELESIIKTQKEIEKKVSLKKEEIFGLEEIKSSMLYLKSREEFVVKARQKLEEVTKNKFALEKDMSLLEKHRESLKQELLSLSKYDTIFKIKKEEMRLHLDKEKAHEIAIAQKEREIELIEAGYLKLNEKIQSIEAKKLQLNYLLELSDWINNYFLELVNFTERNIMLKIRLDFSSTFSRWFCTLVGEGLDVRVDENFTPIITQGEIEMDYSFLSGGERTAVALAYRLALNQTINSVMTSLKTKSLLMLDEPTEGFSENQISKIRDIIQELRVNQLVIVSHEQNVESFVDNIVRLKKDSGASTLSPAFESPSSQFSTISASSDSEDLQLQKI